MKKKAGTLDGYDYKDTAVPVVTIQTQEEQKQEKVDLGQNEQILVNMEVNSIQDEQIAQLDNINQQQDNRISAIETALEEGGINISGGTIVYDAGEW